MSALKLNELESQTRALLKAYRQLKEENHYLLSKQSTLIKERNHLLEKNREATQKIDALLLQMKSSALYKETHE